jgi:hypothetical protein
MVISVPGAVVFDNSIPEVVTAGEPPLVFGGGPAPVAPAVPPATAITFPGVSLVLLTEPAGEPLDPGETPIIIPTSTGPQILSDAVISTLGNAQLPPQIMLVSDGGGDLQAIATDLANVPVLPPIITETGSLQDVSALLGLSTAGSPFGPPIDVQVQSDVTVPEPASLSVLGIGAWALLARRSKRTA